MIFFVLGTLAVGLLLAWISRCRRERAIQWTLAFVSLVVSLYAVEAVLGILAIDPRRRAAWWHDVPLDQRTKAQIVNQLRSQGDNAQPNVIPFGLVAMNGLAVGDGRIFPLAGLSETTVVFCNEAGPWVTYPADEYGFRNPAGSHRPGEVDVVLLGDSFVQGQCVETGQDIASWLRTRGYQAVSLGVSGNGPLIQLAGLAEYATRLRPPVVIWTIYEGNDAHELTRERESEILMRYLERDFSQGLAARQPEIDETLATYVEKRLGPQLARPVDNASRREVDSTSPRRWVDGNIGRFLRLHEIDRRLIEGFGRKPSPSETKPFHPLMVRILDQARRRVESWGGRLHVLYLPELGKSPDRDTIRRQTFRLVEKLGIPLIDVSETLANHPDPDSLYPFRLRLRVGLHFNGDGYRLIAGALAARLPAAQDLRQPPGEGGGSVGTASGL